MERRYLHSSNVLKQLCNLSELEGRCMPKPSVILFTITQTRGGGGEETDYRGMRTSQKEAVPFGFGVEVKF